MYQVSAKEARGSDERNLVASTVTREADQKASCPSKLTAAATNAKSLQSCPTLCDPKHCSPPASWWLPCPWDSPGKNTGVGCHFLLQHMKVKSESEVTQSCLTLGDPMAAAYQAPPSMGFSRQEYWSGLPLPN